MLYINLFITTVAEKNRVENVTTLHVHNGVKDAFRGIPKKHQEYYRGLWHEIVFNSDDQEDYAGEFLAEANEEARAGRLNEKALRKLIARWYEDLLDHRAVDEAKKESNGETFTWGQVKEELGL